MVITIKIILTDFSDCRLAFQSAYENRYTWGPEFKGYKGKCIFEANNAKRIALFSINADLNLSIEDCKDEDIKKSIFSQLWEVSIHRVRRSFESVHGKNTFSYGNSNDWGDEIIVGGKNLGDRYRIKNNVITMVHRNMHGKLIEIFTEDIQDTEVGYLSKNYSSQIFDPTTREVINKKTFFEDIFVMLPETNIWVLSQRIIKLDNSKEDFQIFKFEELQSL